MTELFPYQRVGAEFLATKKRALLADDMGLGKSAQAIAACDAIGARRVLIVCPASVKENWRREVAKFSCHPALVVCLDGKALRDRRETIVSLFAFDDHERADSRKKVVNVNHTANAPHPLRLDAFDGSAAQRRVVSSMNASAKCGEEINDALVGGREGDGPGPISVNGASVGGDPSFAIYDARHVGKNSLVLGDSKYGCVSALHPKRLSDEAFVTPTESGVLHSDLAKSVSKVPAGSDEFDAAKNFGFGGAVHWVALVVSYEQATSHLDFLLTLRLDTIISDESHYLKSRTAKRTKAIFGPKCDGVGGLVERAKHVFLLTGTPTPNHPAELWPMLRAVMPCAIMNPTGRSVVSCMPGDLVEQQRPLSYWAFVQKYCRTRDIGFGTEIVGGKNLPELKARIAPFVLRRKKEEVLADLPPIRFAELPLEGDFKLPAEEVAEVESYLKVEGVYGLAKIALHVATLRRLTGLAKVPPCVEWIKDQIDGGLQKLVVFAHHREVLEALFMGLISGPDRLNTPMMVHGSVSPDDRQRAIDLFQTDEDVQVFIGQLQAAGTGITLTAASDVLFVESSWVPAENEQAAMRVHRIGQKNACLVRFATLAGSIDEKIQRAVMRKTADIAKLFG